MPANFQKPDPNIFAEYVSNQLGQDYSVQFQPRFDNRGDVDMRQSFFNISYEKQGVRLNTNLKMDFAGRSLVETDYGGLQPKRREWSPQIFSDRGDSSFVIGSTWESRFETVPNTGTGAPTYNVAHAVSGPADSLVSIIQSAFGEAKDQIQRSGGQHSVNVGSKIMNMLSAGSDEHNITNVPGGSLLVGRNDRMATIRAAAASMQVFDQTNPAARENEMEQRRLMAQARVNEIQRGRIVPGPRQGQTHGISQFWRNYGLAPDRDNTDRLVAYNLAAQNVLAGNTDVYMPTEKIAKHRTVLSTGRQGVDLLGPNLQPLSASPIPKRGSPVGYRQTTADVGDRIPPQSMVLGTLFSPQFPIAGAGMYFPETTGLNVRSGGYYTGESNVISDNILDLVVTGAEKLELGQSAGSLLPSRSRYTYAKIQRPGEKEFEPLRQQVGSHSFALQNQTVRVPRYYNRTTGAGAVFDQKLIDQGVIMALTDDELKAFSHRLGGTQVVADETASRAYLDMTGYSLVGGKVAISGMKTDIVPFQGSPEISFQGARGGQHSLPLSLLTFETKSMPETFITGLGAMSRDRQMSLMRAYSQSVGGSTGDLIMDYMKGLGSDDRLDINHLASLVPDSDPTRQGAGLMPHELGRDILERVFLGGMSLDDLRGMSSDQVADYAMTEGNRANLARFNIGFVAPGMGSSIAREVDMSEYNMQLRSFQDLVKTQEGANLMGYPKRLKRGAARREFNRMFGFDPDNVIDGRITQQISPFGFYMNTVAGPAVEFSGAGTLGSEELMILNRIAPGYAKALQGGLTDRISKGALTRYDNIGRDNRVRWAHGQMAGISMIESSRGTAGIDLPGALTITTDMASRMAGDVDVMNALAPVQGQITSSQARKSMRNFQKAIEPYFKDVANPRTMHNRPIRFESAPSRYLGSTNAIRTLATEDPYSKEDITRIWNMFQSAMTGGIEAQTRGDATAVTGATNRITRFMTKTYGLPEGNKRNVVGNILKSDIGTTVSRYAYWGEMKQNEVYASKELWESVIRNELVAQGIDPTPEDVQQTYNLIAGKKSTVGTLPASVREQGVAGMAMRYPIVAGEESMFMVNFMTPEQMRRTMRDIPNDAASGLSNLHFRTSGVLSSVMQGDFDLDMMLGMLGIRAERGEDGKLSVSLGAYEKQQGSKVPQLRQEVKDQLDRTANVNYRAIQNSLFPDRRMADEFNPFVGALLDRGRGGLSAVANKLIGEQYSKAGYKDYGILADTLRNYRESKHLMGTSYNFTRALESASVTMGWGDAEIQRARRGRAALYQPFLDVSSGVPYPMMQMYQTSYMNDKGLLNWALPTGDPNDPVRFMKRGHSFTTGGAPALVRDVARHGFRPLERKGNFDFITPTLGAWAFSPEGGRAFTPEGADTYSEMARYRALVDNLPAGKMPPTLGDMTDEWREYYTGTTDAPMSLESALRAPYETIEDPRERTEGMANAVMGWLSANYPDKAKWLQSPFIQSMFTKTYDKAMREDPNYQLPIGMRGDPGTQALVQGSMLQSPIFKMLKKGLPTAQQGIRAMRMLAGGGGGGHLRNWFLGNLENVLGLRTAKMNEEYGSLYAQAEASPVPIRAGGLPHLLGVGAKYGGENTQGTYGQKQDMAQSYLRMGAATMSQLFGLPGEQTYDFLKMLWPGKLGSNSASNIAMGNVMEDALAARVVKFGDLGVHQTNRANVDTRGIEYQGAFVWRGHLPKSLIETEVAATPDFMQLTRNQFDEPVLRFLEQKTSSKTGPVLDQAIQGWQIQAQNTGWIIKNLVEQINMGGDVGEKAEKSLRRTLASYIGDPGDEELAYQAAMEGNIETQLALTPEGSPLGDMIQDPNADPEEIMRLLDTPEYGANTRYNFRTDPNNVVKTQTGYLERVAKAYRNNQPRIFRQVADLLNRAPQFWTNRRKSLGRGDTSFATRALDLSLQFQSFARNVGKGAAAAGTATANVQTLRSRPQPMTLQDKAIRLQQDIAAGVIRQNAAGRWIYGPNGQGRSGQWVSADDLPDPDVVEEMEAQRQRATQQSQPQDTQQQATTQTPSSQTRQSTTTPDPTTTTPQPTDTTPTPQPAQTGGPTPAPFGTGGGGGQNVDDTGVPDPKITGQAQVALRTYSETGAGQTIIGAAQELRRRTGAGAQNLGAILGGMGREQVIEQFGDLIGPAGDAKLLFESLVASYGRGGKTDKMQSVNPAAVDMSAFGALGAMGTDATTNLGGAIADMYALFNAAGPDAKPKKGKPELSQARLEEHLGNLASISADLHDNFKKLTTSTKNFDENLEERQVMLARRSTEETRAKQLLLGEGLEASGFVEYDADGRRFRRSMGPHRTAPSTEQLKQLGEFDDATRALDEAEFAQSQAEQPVRGGKLGRFFRRALGGFGLMYARSIFNIATEGLNVGTGEAMDMAQTFQMAGGAVSGTARPIRNQQQIMANRLAMAGSAYSGIGGITNWLQTTPGVSDAYTAGSAGLGTYAFMQWLGSMGSTGAAGLALPLAGGVAVASILGSAAQKSKDPEAIAARYATGGWAQGFNLTDALAADFRQGGWPDMERRRDAMRSIQTQISMGLTPQEILMSADEKEFATSRALRMMIADNQDLSPQALSNAYTFAAMSRMPAEMAPGIARRDEQTTFGSQQIQQFLNNVGMPLRQQVFGGGLANFYNLTQGMQADVGALTIAGGTAIQSLGAAGQYYMQGMTPEAILQYAQTLGGVAGTAGFDLYSAQMQRAYALQGYGIDAVTPSEYAIEAVVTPAQARLEKLKDAVASADMDRNDQLAKIYAEYYGYPVDMAATTADKELAGLTPQQQEQLIERAGAGAAAQSQERLLRPGMDEGYYQSYARHVRRMSITERGPEDVLRQQMVNLQQALLTQGFGEGQVNEWIEGLRGGSVSAALRGASRAEESLGLAEALGSTFGLSEGGRQRLRETIVGQSFSGQLTPYMRQVYQGMANRDPMSFTRAYASGMSLPGISIQPWMVGNEILGTGFEGTSLEGLPVPVAPFTVSGATHPQFQYLEAMMGPGAFTSGAGQAFAQGYSIPGTNLPAIGGTMGMGWYTSNLQYNAQMASAGISAQQNALQMQYLPIMWGMQDQMTNLGREQALWQFGRQEEQLGMSRRNFFQNFGLQQRQAGMQQAWTREDWAFQDQTRAMQWGWQVEDFQGNVRFMTGRDRRLGERQMERQTILKGMEDDNIERQRERQEELWALEEERFEIQKQQFLEQQEFQQEGIDQQREYYEERFKLQKELTDTQRELQMKQLELSRQQIGIQAGVAAEMKKANDIQMAMSLLMLLNSAEWEKLGIDAKNVGDGILGWLKEAGALVGVNVTSGGSSGGYGGGGGGGDDPIPYASGGLWDFGSSALVGEAGPEVLTMRGDRLTSRMRGEIRPTMYDPWASTATRTAGRPTSQPSEMVVIVNIGNEELKRFTVSAVEAEV